MKLATLLTLAIPAALLGTSCSFNIFDPIDNPGDDPDQLLSAARACFDNGDFECAREYYGQLAGTTYGEQAAAELAFTILDENGAGMKAFLRALGGENVDGGKALNIMASSIAEDGGAGRSRRAAIYTAYQLVDNIPNNAPLRGLVRFISAFALAAEMLAEDNGGDGSYDQTDLVTAATLTACKASNVPATCGGACVPKVSTIIGGAAALATPLTNSPTPAGTVVNPTGNPNWAIFFGAIEAVLLGLNTEIAASGKFGAAASFASQIQTVGSLLTNNSPCFRAMLLQNGVGQ